MIQSIVCISTHTLRKEGDAVRAAQHIDEIISTHTLRKEGDDEDFTVGEKPRDISTHTLRKEGDSKSIQFNQ